MSIFDDPIRLKWVLTLNLKQSLGEVNEDCKLNCNVDYSNFLIKVVLHYWLDFPGRSSRVSTVT